MAQILIVEDDIPLAEQWIVALEAKAHQVLHCTNARDGLASIGVHWPDLVVLDFFYKCINGRAEDHSGLTFVQSANQLAKSLYKPMPKIIAVTASVPDAQFPIDVMESAQLMTNQKLTIRRQKPFATEVLLNDVTAALRA
ncbi:MAG: hypothetical protein AAF290_04990 [Pseudomonadota bacterium]